LVAGFRDLVLVALLVALFVAFFVFLFVFLATLTSARRA
jgi:hypothetical protein